MQYTVNPEGTCIRWHGKYPGSLYLYRSGECTSLLPVTPMRFPNLTKALLLSSLFFLLPDDQADAQQKKSRRQLEKERKENLRRIEETRQILRDVKKEKRSSISELKALEEQERIKEKTIGSIRQELGILDTDISHLQSEEEKLAYTLALLKKEYAAMIYAASRNSPSGLLFYLLASESFQHFHTRLQHLRHYATGRRKQEQEIRKISLQLNQQKLQLAQTRQDKEVLLGRQQEEKKQLEVLEQDKKRLVQQLSKKEKELKAKIDKHQAALRKLENLIASLVKKEIRKSRSGKTNKEGGNSSHSESSEILLTPEGKLISSSFAGNRGRLAWPVETGYISSGFGKHEHPVLKKVYVDNLGIDITTKPGSSVRSVFEGVVGLVGAVPGMDGQIVLLRHGDYFTVYSGLKNIRVSAGEKLKAGAAIGEVKSGDEGAVLQFQVWKNNKRLNPKSWLAAR